MPIATLIPLLITYGIPFVDKIIGMWTSKADVTQADWDSLKALAQNTAKSQMLDALHRAGIDPASPQGVALLAQVPA